MSEQDTSTTTAERFQSENGMTIDEAWEKVREWNLAGKREEAMRGCKIIVEFFPDHEAKSLLQRLEGDAKKEHKESIAESLGGKLANSLASLFGKKKKNNKDKDKDEEKMPVHERQETAATEKSETRELHEKEAEIEEKPVAQEEPAEETEMTTDQTGSAKEKNLEEPESVEEKVIKEESAESHTSKENEASEPQEEEEEIDTNATVLEEERLFATIAYAWIFCLIPLLLKRESTFVQFHAKQGLVMAILLTVFEITIGSLVNMIHGGLGFFLKILYLALLGYAAYNAYQGKYWKIPGVYGLSKKLQL